MRNFSNGEIFERPEFQNNEVRKKWGRLKENRALLCRVGYGWAEMGAGFAGTRTTATSAKRTE